MNYKIGYFITIDDFFYTKIYKIIIRDFLIKYEIVLVFILPLLVY